MIIRFLYITFLVFLQHLLGCSSSESANITEIEESSKFSNFSTSEKALYIPLNDSEYPYAGIPRIVIQTVNRKNIRDRETEIPAELQIWGEKSPESCVFNLTIKGRGNSTWTFPKAPYTIQFKNKESFLGMPKAKKWVLLANYIDRTQMRNAVAFELARKTSLAWTPSGQYAEVYLNGKYIGCYFICEKIEVKKNRLNLSETAYLLEFDVNYDEEYKFRTSFNKLPVNIKSPKNIDSLSFNFIKDYMDSAESALLLEKNNTEYQKFLNQESFADYIIIYAMANNTEPKWPKSVYMHKDTNEKLTAGPVWDFDWATFNIKNYGFSNKDATIFKKLLQKKDFQKILKARWEADKPEFENIFSFIDSLADYISIVGQRNAEIWPINEDKGTVGDRNKPFDEAVDMLKKNIRKRIDELDVLIKKM